MKTKKCSAFRQYGAEHCKVTVCYKHPYAGIIRTGSRVEFKKEFSQPMQEKAISKHGFVRKTPNCAAPLVLLSSIILSCRKMFVKSGRTKNKHKIDTERVQKELADLAARFKRRRRITECREKPCCLNFKSRGIIKMNIQNLNCD